MRPVHLVLALVTTMIWGFNFVVIKLGLGSFPPLLLTVLRFVGAALPVLFLPRPAVPWRLMIPTGLALFLGQYVFLFSAMAHGMPPGLASIVMQSQAFFTILIAALALGDRPTGRQMSGAFVAFLGLAAIGSTIGGDTTALGLGLTLAAALSWAAGNVLLKRAGKVQMLNLIVWLSLVPILPGIALSYSFEGPERIIAAFTGASWVGIGSLVYLVGLSTIVAFAIWGRLFSLYSAATVAPFSLLVPIFGTVSSALVFGESFGPLRLAGMALILVGLAVVALPVHRLGWRRRAA